MPPTSNPPITLAISLIVLFVVLFALGIYWLLFRKGRPVLPRPPRPRAATWPPDTYTSEEDEWEASAPYPEHAMRAVQQARAVDQSRHAVSIDAYPPVHDAPGDLAHWDSAADTLRSRDTSGHADDDTRPAHGLRDTWNSLERALDPKPPASPAPPSLNPALISEIRCPRCLSSRIDTRNLARKAGSTVGSVAGATGAIAAALAGAETGAVVGSIGGPLGTVFGGLAGAVIAGLAGSAAGCAAGSVVGAAIDDNVLDNHVCLACSFSFSAKQD